jgi:hypothetical protein
MVNQLFVGLDTVDDVPVNPPTFVQVSENGLVLHACLDTSSGAMRLPCLGTRLLGIDVRREDGGSNSAFGDRGPRRPDPLARHATKLRPACGYPGQPHGPACQSLRFGHSAFTHFSPPRHRKREYPDCFLWRARKLQARDTGSARLPAAPRFADPTRRRVI